MKDNEEYTIEPKDLIVGNFYNTNQGYSGLEFLGNSGYSKVAFLFSNIGKTSYSKQSTSWAIKKYPEFKDRLKSVDFSTHHVDGWSYPNNLKFQLDVKIIKATNISRAFYKNRIIKDNGETIEVRNG